MDLTAVIARVRADGHTIRETESTYQFYANDEYIKSLEVRGLLVKGDCHKIRNSTFRLYKEKWYKRAK
ncbi:MAG: hypothetical protein K0R00_41 [Herbinix sp.]|jgi:hypothetical protein|nr:hypothetical protein [Herbinix sp.]